MSHTIDYTYCIMKKFSNWLIEKRAWLALYVPLYLIMYFSLEHAITADYWVSWCPLDDLIPFCSPFVIFYVLWFPFIGLTGLYLLFKDTDAFTRYMSFIAVGFTVSLCICAIFPNGQNMRPDLTGSTGIFERMIQALYRTDTNTNVLPSMHVVAAVNVCFAVFKSKKLRKPLICVLSTLLAALICAATVLIKQHSVLDIFAAVALCIPLWFVIYFPSWKKVEKKSLK